VVVHFAHDHTHCLGAVKGEVAQVWPLVQEVAVCEDRVGLAEALVDEVHDNWQVVLALVLLGGEGGRDKQSAIWGLDRREAVEWERWRCIGLPVGK
jgi:hypothetical protein